MFGSSGPDRLSSADASALLRVVGSAEDARALRIARNAAQDPAAARVALNGDVADAILGATRYDAFVGVGRTDRLQELIRGVSDAGTLDVVAQQRVAQLLFDNDYAATRARGLLELAVVTNSKNGTTIVGGRLISRAVHEFSGDYGDDVIRALSMATEADRSNVLA